MVVDPERVLARPLTSVIAAGAVLVVLAIPVFHIHTADSGVDGLPRPRSDADLRPDAGRLPG